jgi:hypothetical protein
MTREEFEAWDIVNAIEVECGIPPTPRPFHRSPYVDTRPIRITPATTAIDIANLNDGGGMYLDVFRRP